jgi:hypothetical protein
LLFNVSLCPGTICEPVASLEPKQIRTSLPPSQRTNDLVFEQVQRAFLNPRGWHHRRDLQSDRRLRCGQDLDLAMHRACGNPYRRCSQLLTHLE